MKYIFRCIFLFSAFLQQTPLISGLSFSFQMTYETDSIFECGKLSVEDFTITPAESNDISLTDVALFGILCTGKHIAIHASKMTQNNPEKIALMKEDLKSSNNKLNDLLSKTKCIQEKIEREKTEQKKLNESTDKNMSIARKQLSDIYQKKYKKS